MEVYGFSVDAYNALIVFLSPDQKSAFDDLVKYDDSNPGSPFYRIDDTIAYSDWVSRTLGDEGEFNGFYNWGTFVIGKSQGSGGAP